MEAQLEHGLQQKRESDLIAVTVRLNDNDDSARELSVRPAQAIHESIAEAFGCKVWQLEEIEFGGQAVEQGVTYEDYGVEVPFWPIVVCPQPKKNCFFVCVAEGPCV